MPALAQDVLSSGRVTTVKPLDSFHRLVCDINRILGPSSGLNSNDVDPKDIEKLMDKYTSNESEWSQYAYADHTRAYTRNLVDHGNGKSNLILKGSLQETLYSWPDRDLVNDDKPSPLRIKKETTYRENQVTYMSDNVSLK
ncbi:MAG: hypothetical protein M1835_003357 [Candelina submexicana]|nr:MAG: hypothetical protein M1835_003357 [Candelina submexicana]